MYISNIQDITALPTKFENIFISKNEKNGSKSMKSSFWQTHTQYDKSNF